jgi:predicted ATPase
MNKFDDGNEQSVDEDILDQLLQSVIDFTKPTSNTENNNNHSNHSPSASHNSNTPSHKNSPSSIEPTSAVHLTKIYFKNYKALSRCELHLGSMSILTGSNNAGKSTALGALQILAAGLRVARRLKPKNLSTPEGIRPAYVIPTDQLVVSLENVHTDYTDNETTVRFEYKNDDALTLWFPPDGGCILYISEFGGNYPKTPTTFRKAFPSGLVCVPVLGPLEHNEPLLQEQTVNKALETHRAARHFRNYWYRYPDNFVTFANLIAETWPGVEIEPPELHISSPPELHMFCREHRITRELYWMGFGFQVWCQLLTHVSRAGPNDILVVDEPETYLHPIVQCRLLNILRGTGAQVVLATHSAPIVMNAGPFEVLHITNSTRKARPQPSPSKALAFQLGLRTLE